MTFDLGAGLAVLERTPAVLEALLSDLPEPWTTGNEGAETWSPFDVVGHLIDGEQTDWMVRLHVILSSKFHAVAFSSSGEILIVGSVRDRVKLSGR